MPEPVRYSNAPIVEAIIDLRVTQAQGFSIDDLEAIQEMVVDRYPNQESEYVYSGQFYVEEVGNPLQTEATHQHNGFRFTSKDGQQTLYTRLDSFAFSVRAPYDYWEPFRDEAHRLWNLYRSIAEVEGITRAAVRYVNQIDFPEGVEIEDYFRTYPEVSPALPNEGTLGGFFMQLQLWQEDLHCWLVVNEGTAPPLDPGTVSILLDFDLFQERFEEPWRADEDAAVWEFLEQLRVRKNEVFEASITEEMRRLIR